MDVFRSAGHPEQAATFFAVDAFFYSFTAVFSRGLLAWIHILVRREKLDKPLVALFLAWIDKNAIENNPDSRLSMIQPTGKEKTAC